MEDTVAKKKSFLDDDEVMMTPGQLADARAMAVHGVNPNVIAELLDVSDVELVGVHGGELKTAITSKEKSNVDNALYEMAASKTSSAATLFWVKSYGIPPTTPQSDTAAKPDKYKRFSGDPNEPVKFTVYNNDHEPNHDY